MLTELRAKVGGLCRPAQEGQLHCPLIVRSTSEDVITAHLVLAFRTLNPRWWVPDLLNEALGTRRFRRQVYRRLRIEPWVNKPAYARELLPWDEGSTRVDIQIKWENPPTTVFMEMKYGSELAGGTANSGSQQGYATDQLARNLRVALLECGYFGLDRLFAAKTRDFVLVLVGPVQGDPLVSRYRRPESLRAAVPYSELLRKLPHAPFVGELDYTRLAHIFSRQKPWFGRAERCLCELLADYLDFKRANPPPGIRLSQRKFCYQAESGGG